MIRWFAPPIQKKKQLLLLLFSWVLIQSLLYSHHGIQPILESLKYINAAQYLIENGHLPELRYFFYLTTTLVIAFFTKTGLGFAGVIWFQLLLNAIATLQFYKALCTLQTKPYSAFAATLLLILCIPFQSWNFYLYTESLFYSCILLFFSHCIRSKQLSFTSVFTQAVLLLLVIVSRPLGILFLPCWIIYVIGKANNKWKVVLITASVASLALFVFIANLILGNISDWPILTSAENNEIICDMPVGDKMNLEAFKNKPPLAQLFSYIYAHPLHFGRLAVQRLFRFFFLVRPYYSLLHNAALIGLCFILYTPLLIGVFTFRKRFFSSTAVFLVSIILLFCIAVALQCDDYHNRFHHAIIPVFLYCGIFGTFEEYNKS